MKDETIKEFIRTTENHIYKEVAKNLNLLLGKNKTASLSTGIFLKLPIDVSIEKVNEPLPKLHKELKSFMSYFSAYVKMESDPKVYFKFLYHDEKDLRAISNHLNRHNMFYAFVYMHEVQHIIRKHTTSTYNNLMLRIADDVVQAHELINVAEDYAINYSIKDLFISAGFTSKWNEIQEIGLYNGQYHKDQMSDMDILRDIIKQNKPLTKTPLSDMLSAIEFDGKTINQPTEGYAQGESGKDADGEGDAKDEHVDKISTASDDVDEALSDLSASIKDIISSNTKGTKAGDLFETMFSAISVDTGWFKKIKASFKRQVYYKTHDYTTSWANLNNTYRRIYKAPKKQFIDSKINIILSVDHSGSMATEDLQRLLYLIESESTRIGTLTVLIHDTRIVKEFVIENEYDIAECPEFKEALATRYVSGGTSHACVFEHIQGMNLKDPNMYIYMSFSDNYSDIDNVFGNYPAMRHLTNYWVCTENNPVNVIGTNIMMA